MGRFTNEECGTRTISYDYFNDINLVGQKIEMYVYDHRADLVDSGSSITMSSYTWGVRDCDTLIMYSTISTTTGDTAAFYGCTWLGAGEDSILVIRYDQAVETKMDTIVIK